MIETKGVFMFCGSCGVPVDEGARFCASCGAPQAPPVVQPPAVPQPPVAPQPPAAPQPVNPGAPPPPLGYAETVGQPSGNPGSSSGRRGKGMIFGAAAASVVLLGAAWFVFIRDGGSAAGVDASGRSVVVGDGPSKAPKEIWSEKVDCSYSECAAIVGDALFFHDDDELIALDSGSGDELWSADFDGLFSVTALGDGLFVQSGDWDEAGVQIHRVSPSDGETLWTVDSDDEYSQSIYEFVIDGVVLLTDSEKVIGLDVSNGEELWQEDGYAEAVCDDKVLISDSGDLVAVDAKSGDDGWQEKVDLSGSVRCSGGAAVFADDGLVALDLGSGEERWSYSDGVDGDFIVYNDSVVFQDDDEFVSLKASNGTENWREDMGAENGSGLYSSTVFGSYAWGYDGSEVFAFNLSNGAKGENADVDKLGEQGGILLKDQIIGFSDDEMSAFDAVSFEETWSVDFESEGSDGYVDGFAIGNLLFVFDGDQIRAFR